MALQGTQRDASQRLIDDLANQEPDNGYTGNIFLLWPNIIGYSRIVLAFVSLYYMPLHPKTCSLFYSLSCLLDALDGYVARILDQSSRFGAALDMVTDRCTTTCLLVFLSSAWPRWSLAFQGLISLDLASHYLHMYATLAMGGSGSHKVVDQKRSWWLNLYYSNKIVLFILCAFNEVFFIAVYLLAFTASPGGELDSIKDLSSSIPHSAGALEIARANKISDYWPLLIARISFPFMLVKQCLNVLQLVNASQMLAEGDIEMRRAARRAKETKRT